MKRPFFTTLTYWRGEWAGIKAAKWYLGAYIVTFYFTIKTVTTHGWFSFSVPGTAYGIYYFGFDPAIWGFLTGVFVALGYPKAKNAANVRVSQLLTPPPPPPPKQGDGEFGFDPTEDRPRPLGE